MGTGRGRPTFALYTMAAKRCENSSCLGGEICEEWNCCENDSQMPESKRSKLSLKKRRFAQPLAEVDMNTLCKPVVPSNTQKQTDWCVNVFESWRSARDGEKCPANLLQQGTVEELNFWLCRFVVVARRSDGNVEGAHTGRSICPSVYCRPVYYTSLYIQHLKSHRKLDSFTWFKSSQRHRKVEI